MTDLVPDACPRCHDHKVTGVGRAVAAWWLCPSCGNVWATALPPAEALFPTGPGNVVRDHDERLSVRRDVDAVKAERAT